MGTFSQELRDFMEATRFTTQDMAELCSVSVHTIASWRIGRKEPRPKRREQLLAAMWTVARKIEELLQEN